MGVKHGLSHWGNNKAEGFREYGIEEDILA